MCRSCTGEPDGRLALAGKGAGQQLLLKQDKLEKGLRPKDDEVAKALTDALRVEVKTTTPLPLLPHFKQDGVTIEYWKTTFGQAPGKFWSREINKQGQLHQQEGGAEFHPHDD